MLSLAVPASCVHAPSSPAPVPRVGSTRRPRWLLSGASFPPGRWAHADQRPAEHTGLPSLPQTLAGASVLNDFNAQDWRRKKKKKIGDNLGEATINKIIVIFKNWEACFIKNFFCFLNESFFLSLFIFGSVGSSFLCEGFL